MDIVQGSQRLILYSLMLAALVACQPKTTQGLSKEENPISWIDKDENENYVARHECSFVQAGNEFVMFGGRESAKRLDIYDFEQNTWRQGKQAPKEFNHFQATFHKGFIWVIGSFKTNSYPNELPEEHVWLYDLPNDEWIKGPEIPKERRRGGAGLVVYDDKFYLVGGNTIGHNGGYVNWFDEYDPKKNTWTILADAPRARDHFHAAIYDDQLYAVAGRQSGGSGGTFTPLVDTVDVFDFKKASWSSLPQPLPTPRAAPGIAVFQEELLVMGGEGEIAGPAYKIVEAYDFGTQKWTRKSDMIYARHGTQAILSGEGIYMAGGSPLRGGGNQLNMEVYFKDNAQGTKLQVVELELPEAMEIPVGEETTIELNNKSRVAGIFVKDLRIEGATGIPMEIKTLVQNRLLDPGETLKITIGSTGTVGVGMGELVVYYNGTQMKRMRLSMK